LDGHVLAMPESRDLYNFCWPLDGHVLAMPCSSDERHVANANHIICNWER